LQVMTFTRDVGNNPTAVAQTDLADLTDRRVGLLWGLGIHPDTDATLLRASTKSWGISVSHAHLFGSTCGRELVQRRHRGVR